MLLQATGFVCKNAQKFSLAHKLTATFTTLPYIRHTAPIVRFSTTVESKAMPHSTLSWPEFFALRRKMQLIQRLSGIPFVLAFWAAEGFVLSLPIFDPTKTIFELDPMVIVGLGTVAGSVASYFFGATASGLAWRLFRPGKVRLLDQKQKDFYSRIQKHRANVPPNPTQMNFNFDFYGEKVRSVSDYRTWLRRQRQMLADRRFAV